MKKFRFILALVLVLTMVLSTPLMALAKSWDVTDSAGVENAFATDTDDEVIINMQNDIVMENSVVANEGQNYTINGNGNTIADVMIGGEGSVEINADVTSEVNSAAMEVYDAASVTVNGDVTGKSGNPDDVDYSDPMAYSDGDAGVYAYDQAEITINGDVSGGNGYGTYGYAGDGVYAEDEAKVTVNGNVTGGSVTADPEVEAYYNEEYDYYSNAYAGDGVEAEDEATVIVTGDVTGGSTNGDMGNGGYGVYADGGSHYDEYGEFVSEIPSVTVGGDVTGGNATNGTAGDGVFAADLAKVEVDGSVTGGDATSGLAGAGIYTTNDSIITVGGDVTGGTATDDGESGNGIYADCNGYYWEGNEEGIEQGSVTVKGTVSGGEGAASIFFPVYEEDVEYIQDVMEEVENLDFEANLEAALEKDPADYTEDDEDLMYLEMALDIMMRNGDLTPEEVNAFFEGTSSLESVEEIVAFAQEFIKEQMTGEMDPMKLALSNTGYTYSNITVGAVSKENGPAYGSNAGEKYAQAVADIYVEEVGIATPNTGDSFNPMLVLAVALVSLMGTAALVFKKKAA